MKKTLQNVLLVLGLFAASASISTAFANDSTEFDGENCRRQVNDELRCLVCVIYTEDNGTVRGMEAVASVVFARVESSSYPNSVCGVVYQKGQFTGVRGRNASLPHNSPSLYDVVNVAQEALRHRRAGPYLGFRAPVGKNRNRCAKSGAVQIGARGNCYQHSGEVELDVMDGLIPDEFTAI